MLINLFFLSRPVNVAIAALTILIAAALSVQFNFQNNVFLVMIAVALITASANIVNDIFDIEIDKINKPKRFLASGKVSLKNAWITYGLLNATGLFVAWLTTNTLTLIAFLSILILYSYSSYFKRTILAGNFVVSFMSALTFICAALAVNDLQAGIIPAVFAFLFHFGRELLKDIQDLTGDISQNVVTFPGRFGRKKTFLLVNIIFLTLSGFLFLPEVLNSFNVYYNYIVIFGVFPILMFVSIIIWFKNDPATLGKLSSLLKLGMIIGLAAIFCGINLTP